MAKDLHERPFDEGTLVKLSLYRDYLREWLPVFLGAKKPRFRTVNIFDFFAGPGTDVESNPGSPLITLEELRPYSGTALQLAEDVNLYFNEFDKQKLQQLKTAIGGLPATDTQWNIKYAAKDFQDAFDAWLPLMNQNRAANFLFLDQSGIKHITNEVFETIVGLPATDFLFFISSSTIYRFRDHPRIREHLDVSKSAVTDSDYLHIHGVVLDYYRSLIPAGRDYYLASFSIKKRSNIYGLVFGSGHLLGIDKFVRVCWKEDTQRGQANFDIDREGIKPGQRFLFGMGKPKKLAIFEQQLAEQILARKLQTNRDIYTYALLHGFLPKHAKAVCKALMERGELPRQRMNISYDECKVEAMARPVEHR